MLKPEGMQLENTVSREAGVYSGRGRVRPGDLDPRNTRGLVSGSYNGTDSSRLRGLGTEIRHGRHDLRGSKIATILAKPWDDHADFHKQWFAGQAMFAYTGRADRQRGLMATSVTPGVPTTLVSAPQVMALFDIEYQERRRAMALQRLEPGGGRQPPVNEEFIVGMSGEDDVGGYYPDETIYEEFAADAPLQTPPENEQDALNRILLIVSGRVAFLKQAATALNAAIQQATPRTVTGTANDPLFPPPGIVPATILQLLTARATVTGGTPTANALAKVLEDVTRLLTGIARVTEVASRANLNPAKQNPRAAMNYYTSTMQFGSLYADETMQNDSLLRVMIFLRDLYSKMSVGGDYSMQQSFSALNDIAADLGVNIAIVPLPMASILEGPRTSSTSTTTEQERLAEQVRLAEQARQAEETARRLAQRLPRPPQPRPAERDTIGVIAESYRFVGIAMGIENTETDLLKVDAAVAGNTKCQNYWGQGVRAGMHVGFIVCRRLEGGIDAPFKIIPWSDSERSFPTTVEMVSASFDARNPIEDGLFYYVGVVVYTEARGPHSSKMYGDTIPSDPTRGPVLAPLGRYGDGVDLTRMVRDYASLRDAIVVDVSPKPEHLLNPFSAFSSFSTLTRSRR